jgi:hypothetical protein
MPCAPTKMEATGIQYNTINYHSEAWKMRPNRGESKPEVDCQGVSGRVTIVHKVDSTTNGSKGSGTSTGP